jgi:hypothetical protein
MPQTGSTTSASAGVSRGVELVVTNYFFTYCCGFASNFVLQTFAQK